MAGIEFFATNFSYIDKESGEEKYVGLKEQGGSKLIPEGPLKAGALYTIAMSTNSVKGLYKIESYYIGTLVVNEENGIFKIIDGQQRTTALNLIALALKHEFGFDRLKAVNLTSQLGRSQMRIFKNYLPSKKISENDENELTRGYRHAHDALKKVLEERQFESQSFFNYLFDKVIIFRSILPNDLDLNLYFERFNSRGEQLEAHEILKAQ